MPSSLVQPRGALTPTKSENQPTPSGVDFYLKDWITDGASAAAREPHNG